MTTIQTPAKARSDAAQATASRGARTATDPRPYLLHGRMLTVGALSWATGFVFLGNGPEGTVENFVYFMSAMGFQVGLLFLIRALWLSRALGTGRVASTVLRVEAGLVSLAMLSSRADGVGVSDLDQLGWALLDACWPISMLGMFAIGIRVAIAGRWSGVTRFWPMVAESWAMVVIPSMLIFGQTVAGHVVAPAHLVLGYGVLGILVSRKAD
jgi:hypothetical protein